MQDSAERFVLGSIRFWNSVLIASLYFVGFMMIGVPQSKAWMACLILIFMQMMSLGAGRIRQIGIAFVLLASIYWIDIFPLQNLSHIAVAPLAIAQNAPVFQSSPRVDVQKPTEPSALGKGQYLLSLHRVIGHDNPQGCTNGGWDCMTNLCKAELGPASGRSDAGCWSQGYQWQCTFACVIYHPVIP